jgi:hypothetical protein
MSQCQGCGVAVTYRGRGRPRKWCHSCNEANKDAIAEKKRAYREANKDALAEKQRAYYEANKDAIAEKKRAYYEANKDALAEKQRAYREANKDAIAEKQRAKKGLLCPECGEHVRKPGLCGWCKRGIGLEPDDRRDAAL